MNYFPCNNIGISVDGVSHKGNLKLRNEYIPIVSPKKIYEVGSSTSDYITTPTGLLVFDNNLVVLFRRAGYYGSDGSLVCDDFMWKQKYNLQSLRTKIGERNICCINGELYSTQKSEGRWCIYKINDDGTKTMVASSPDSTTYGGASAPFVNDNGEDCIVIINTNYNNRCYYYNLSTQTWTQCTLKMPSNNPIDILWPSNEKNCVICEFIKTSNTPMQLYKYNFNDDTYTNIASWIDENNALGTFTSYSDISMVCNDTMYHIRTGDIRTRYINSAYESVRTDVILDSVGKVVFVINADFGTEEYYTFVDACWFKDGIYFLYHCGGGRYKIFKFDPKTRRMYDMSIPHLVIDE